MAALFMITGMLTFNLLGFGIYFAFFKKPKNRVSSILGLTFLFSSIVGISFLVFLIAR